MRGHVEQKEDLWLQVLVPEAALPDGCDERGWVPKELQLVASGDESAHRVSHDGHQPRVWRAAHVAYLRRLTSCVEDGAADIGAGSEATLEVEGPVRVAEAPEVRWWAGLLDGACDGRARRLVDMHKEEIGRDTCDGLSVASDVDVLVPIPSDGMVSAVAMVDRGKLGEEPRGVVGVEVACAIKALAQCSTVGLRGR